MNWKHGLGVVAFAALSLVPPSLGAVARTEKVLVALEKGGAVLLDGRTGKVIQRYQTGPNAFGALFSKNGKRAFVTDKDNGTLSEIDLGTNRVLNSIAIGSQAQQPDITSDGTMYIPLSGEAAIAVVDASGSPRLVSKIPTGAGSKPHIVSLSPDQATLWATVQGTDPKVIALKTARGRAALLKEFRYDLFPRVISATNGAAFFTGMHSTGLHAASLTSDKVATMYMDIYGSGSEAAKQIEGVSFAARGLIGLTHEGRKALIVVSATLPARKHCDISPLADKPYWVSMDSTAEVAFVSIPNKGLVEAYDIRSCRKTPLWSTNVGGLAKRLALSETP